LIGVWQQSQQANQPQDFGELPEQDEKDIPGDKAQQPEVDNKDSDAKNTDKQPSEDESDKAQQSVDFGKDNAQNLGKSLGYGSYPIDW
jgi:hypothetical protein